MKYLTFISTLLALASAAPLAEVTVAEDVQAEKPSMDMTANGVKILPRFAESKPKDGALRKEVFQNHWSVSSTNMLTRFMMGVGPPCGIAGCYVTAMEATIKYKDGKEANIDTNAWLHHIALFGSGGGQGSLWACGNERPTLRLNEKSKYGIDWPVNTGFMMMVDLMTEDVKPKDLYLYITYEYVPKDSVQGLTYKAARMYWLTIGEPAAKNGVYHFTSLPQSTVAGTLLYAIGHMHDGGTDMRLFKSGSSTPLCKSVMHYNRRPGYAPPSNSHRRRDGHGGHGGGMEHISDPGACTDFGELASNDRIYSEAWYDANQHPLMEHNGKKENLMGNMRVYMGPK